MSQRMTRRIEALEIRIEDARAVSTLQGHPGWEALVRIIDAGIDRRRRRVLSSDCDYDEVKSIRYEVDWLERLKKTPDIDQADLKKWLEDIANLRERAKIQEELDMSSASEEPSS